MPRVEFPSDTTCPVSGGPGIGRASNSGGSTTGRAVGGIDQAVWQAIDRILDNVGEMVTVEDLARAARYSKFHFSRAFQRVTGISPGRFLAAVRIQEAKRLLGTTSLSVAEISHRVGYASVGAFGSRFASTVGVSPTTFRRMVGRVSHRTGAGVSRAVASAAPPRVGPRVERRRAEERVGREGRRSRGKDLSIPRPGS
ncbi:AraC-type DNA-binding protein [Actinoalloteichus cyanogriseus DSM 43889]|uniref:AraC-type DNA-binding protein n=1 Tax=Actinoalloteichus caeruleus DSM 43889 TaxID=1120930 RepID=A0ABT1JE46_ACTCY|nr:AraC-type DNA-binding protein [Actinoalloteichus caeruleus DSM 43889]